MRAAAQPVAYRGARVEGAHGGVPWIAVHRFYTFFLLGIVHFTALCIVQRTLQYTVVQLSTQSNPFQPKKLIPTHCNPMYSHVRHEEKPPRTHLFAKAHLGRLFSHQQLL